MLHCYWLSIFHVLGITFSRVRQFVWCFLRCLLVVHCFGLASLFSSCIRKLVKRILQVCRSEIGWRQEQPGLHDLGSLLQDAKSRRAAGLRPSAAACAKSGSPLAKCSVRRNWYRSLSTSWVPPEYLQKASEGFGKFAAFWKNPERFWSKCSKNLVKYW